MSLLELDEPIHLVEYDPQWPIFFTQEAQQLAKIFGPDLVGIEHFGSTAVPGLPAKPIIDILVGLQDLQLFYAHAPALAQLGYVNFGSAGVSERLYVRKRNGEYSVNLAVTTYGNTLWQDNLIIRDYLRAHPDTARLYAQTKADIIAQGHNKLLKYSDLKADFIKNLLEQARAWAADNKRDSTAQSQE